MNDKFLKDWMIDLTINLSSNPYNITQEQIKQHLSNHINLPYVAIFNDTLLEKLEKYLIIQKSGDSYVSPWGYLIRHNTNAIKILRNCVYSYEVHKKHSGISVNNILHKVFNNLFTERQITILKLRYGLNNNRKHTLQEIAQKFNITKERVRQIQNQCIQELYNDDDFVSVFIAEFIHSCGSLVINNNNFTNTHDMMFKILDIEYYNVPYLNAHIIGAIDEIKYDLNKIKNYFDFKLYDVSYPDFSNICYISDYDKLMFYNICNQYVSKKIRNSDCYIIREALKAHNGREHYSIFAKTCNKIKQTNHSDIYWQKITSNYAISNKEYCGIVRTGDQGVYALKSFGYNRPKLSYFDACTNIVQEIYEQTKKPVSYSKIKYMISELRDHVNHNSLNIALTLNKNIIRLPYNFYVPNYVQNIEEQSKYVIESSICSIELCYKKINKYSDVYCYKHHMKQKIEHNKSKIQERNTNIVLDYHNNATMNELREKYNIKQNQIRKILNSCIPDRNKINKNSIYKYIISRYMCGISVNNIICNNDLNISHPTAYGILYRNNIKRS